MKLDAYASMPHYLEHVLPIWRALKPELRGTLYAPLSFAGAVEGVSPLRDLRSPPAGVQPALVSSWQDMHVCQGRQVVFVEHGAGQSYMGDPHAASNPSYSGGQQRDRVVLFIVPNELCATLNERAYPGVPNAVVGSPKLDTWHQLTIPKHEPPVVAISFHWDCTLCPESRSAWRHYERSVGEIAAQAKQAGWRLIGHAHPRIAHQIEPAWRAVGVPFVDDFAQVLEEADVYCCDNSSTLYEFASTRRPVVVLNAPWYRREIEHGLRFWQGAEVGVQCDEPSELIGAVRVALADPRYVRKNRERCVQLAYAHTDGRAAQRAATAVEQRLAQLSESDWSDVSASNPFAGTNVRTANERQTSQTAFVVPQSNVRTVLSWVGSDPVRARAALTDERLKSTKEQRASLIEKLEGLVS